MHALAFSRDGSKLASASEGGVLVHEVRTGDINAIIEGQSGPAALAFSADGRWLAVAAKDRTVRVYRGGQRGPEGGDPLALGLAGRGRLRGDGRTLLALGGPHLLFRSLP